MSAVAGNYLAGPRHVSKSSLTSWYISGSTFSQSVISSRVGRCPFHDHFVAMLATRFKNRLCQGSSREKRASVSGSTLPPISTGRPSTSPWQASSIAAGGSGEAASGRRRGRLGSAPDGRCAGAAGPRGCRARPDLRLFSACSETERATPQKMRGALGRSSLEPTYKVPPSRLEHSVASP